MTGITFKAIRGLNAYRKPILAAITVAMFMGLLAGCEEAHTLSSQPSAQLKEPIKVSPYGSVDISVLSEQIKQLVRSLEYSDKVAEHFANMVIDWKDAQWLPVLITWKEKLANARQECKQGKISRNHVAKIEESVIRELSHRIRKQFNYEEHVFELGDVIQNQKADCLGYSQLTYLAGNTVGLSIRPIIVLDYDRQEEKDQKAHIACIIDLFDGQLVMADLAMFSDLISKAFKLENQFVKVGNFWEVRNKDNPLRIHRRIQVLDRNGLIAGIYYNQGTAYGAKGEHDRAILDYDKAIQIDPRFALAYYNRGVAYEAKGKYDRAILDYDRAIQIDPRFALAYCSRGNVYLEKGEYDRAILDYDRAIQIDPRDTHAYNNRGSAYYKKGEHDRAILDYDRAIQIDPRDAEAYNNRGAAYAYGAKGEHDRAILDFTKAIENDARHAKAYCNRGIAYASKGEHDRAILDFTKAIKINPKYSFAYYSRGTICAVSGKSEEAKKDLLKAVELNPSLKPQLKQLSDQFKLGL